jgi:hypothetical protein
LPVRQEMCRKLGSFEAVFAELRLGMEFRLIPIAISVDATDT